MPIVRRLTGRRRSSGRRRKTPARKPRKYVRKASGVRRSGTRKSGNRKSGYRKSSNRKRPGRKPTKAVKKPRRPSAGNAGLWDHEFQMLRTVSSHRKPTKPRAQKRKPTKSSVPKNSWDQTWGQTIKARKPGRQPVPLSTPRDKGQYHLGYTMPHMPKGALHKAADWIHYDMPDYGTNSDFGPGLIVRSKQGPRFSARAVYEDAASQGYKWYEITCYYGGKAHRLLVRDNGSPFWSR